MVLYKSRNNKATLNLDKINSYQLKLYRRLIKLITYIPLRNINNYFKRITTINLVSFFTVMILEKEYKSRIWQKSDVNVRVLIERFSFKFLMRV